MSTRFESRKPGPPGEYIVEVDGPDGLKHHVGPFRFRQEAENWMAQNPGDPACEAKAKKKRSRNKNAKSRRPRSSS